MACRIWSQVGRNIRKWDGAILYTCSHSGRVSGAEEKSCDFVWGSDFKAANQVSGHILAVNDGAQNLGVRRPVVVPIGSSSVNNKGKGTGFVPTCREGQDVGETSCTLESTGCVLNPFKRKAECVGLPLLESNEKRCRQYLDVCTSAGDLGLEYQGRSVNVLKRKACDLDESLLNDSGMHVTQPSD